MMAQMTFWGGVSTLAFTTWLVGCAPEPRTVRCSNGGECKEHDAKYEYCLQGRCVECVARGSCGMNRICSDGMCLVEKPQ